MTSGKCKIKDWNICYEKFGNGPHVLLMIPGAIGTGRSDYYPQLFGPHALNQNEFTLICIELPGWGRSSPPPRLYGPKVYENDAECSNLLMQKLGYDYYSVFGWSDGAKCAIILATMYPSRIRNCIVSGLLTYCVPNDIKAICATHNTKHWPQAMIDNYEPIYGNDLQYVWDQYMKFCANAISFFPNGMCNSKLTNIRCPVLILHGNQDPLVANEHPVYAHKQIPDSRIHRFVKGSHNMHHTFPKEFKTVVENFLNEN